MRRARRYWWAVVLVVVVALLAPGTARAVTGVSSATANTSATTHR